MVDISLVLSLYCININGAAADESTPFSPRSPYAVAGCLGGGKLSGG